MQIRLLNDSVEVEGYVNAVERKSKPLKTKIGEFVERICKGAFQRALERNDNVRLLLNHDWGKDLGGTKAGNVELTEDNIGLKVRATITDADVVKKARNGDLVGWSFGFLDRDVDKHEENGILTRDVKDLDLKEISILDRTRTPAYDGTLVTVRAEEDLYHGEAFLDDIEIRDYTVPKQQNVEKIDYSAYDALIQSLKEEK